MRHSIAAAGALAAVPGCLVVPVFSGRRFPSAVRALDEAGAGTLGSRLRRSGFGGERGEARLLMDLPGVAADRVLAIGCGRRSRIDARRFVEIAGHAARELARAGDGEASSALALVSVARRDRHWRVAQIARRIEARAYRHARPDAPADRGPGSIVHLVADERSCAAAARALAEALATAGGEALARELGDRPPDRCTPTALAEAATALATRHATVRTEVLDAAGIGEIGMGAVLAVARGSAEPATFSIVRYTHPEIDERSAPIVLVGKGVSFDSGGLSIKGAQAMQHMKLDMAGAGAVLGAMEAIARLAPRCRVIALLPAVENLPGPGAMRPGDVVTTLSGTTVEVLNTDAEGRLILADALHFAARFEPAVVIDVATLTGSTATTFGNHLTALYTDDRRLERELDAAGRAAHDRVRAMPLLEEYREPLRSKVADLANVGGTGAGAIVAACFLRRFARTAPWAHLDVAGTAVRSGAATGRPVALLVRWLMDRSGATAGDGAGPRSVG